MLLYADVLYCVFCSQEVKMRGARRSVRLTRDPPESERVDAQPPVLPRARSQRSSREDMSMDPRRSLDESRRGVVRGGRSEEVREAMDVEQAMDESMGIGRSDEGMGEFQGGTQASGFGYPFSFQDPDYSMGDVSEYSSYIPYSPYMPYIPHYDPPYPMYPPSPVHQSTAYPEQDEPVPPPQPEPVIQIPRPHLPERRRVKMTEYLKLDAPKFNPGDDPFEYLRSVRMITSELGADDCRAIEMAGFTLKCKKAQEWFKNYVEPRMDSMSWGEFANEFAGWAFPDSSREMKVVEFEQLRQTDEMSVDEFTDKFLDLLQYVGQAYDTDQKKARRYTMRLHPRYSSLILPAEKESFHSIVDAARKMEASSNIQKQSRAQASSSKAPSTGTSGSKRWDKAKGAKKKFWGKVKSGLGFGSGSSSGTANPVCQRCGRPHRGAC